MTVFCSDIDGTLLNSERTVSDRTIRAIQEIRAAGHTFVLCSSRMPSSMNALEELYGGGETPMIAYNGGLVLAADGRITLDIPISPTDAIHIFETSRMLNVHSSFYSGDDWFAWAQDKWTDREASNTGVSPSDSTAAEYYESNRIQSHPPHKVMCMGNADLIDEIELRFAKVPRLVTYRSKGTYLEIANAGCSKGEGLTMVARELNVDPRDCYFFGDNYNDLSAFKVVGTSVAVANAKEAVLDAASVLTARHHDDGVAIFLEDWIKRH